MKAEAIFISTLLPDHYRCSARVNGVHCKSEIGINEITDEKYFRLFIKVIESEYGPRFLDIFHHTCTDHREFTVYLKPHNYIPVVGQELSLLSQKIFPLAEELSDNSLYNEMQQSYRMSLMTGLFKIIDRNFYPKEFIQELKRKRSSIFKFRDIDMDKLDHKYKLWIGESDYEGVE